MDTLILDADDHMGDELECGIVGSGIYMCPQLEGFKNEVEIMKQSIACKAEKHQLYFEEEWLGERRRQ
jgi:hypothetical protein